MKKSRLVALILGLVMPVSLFSGCAKTTTPPLSGGDAPEAETTKAPEESQETQTEQPSGEKVKVKLYMLPQDDDSDIVKQRFEFIKGKVEAKFPDYDIEWTRMAPGTDYRQQYDKLLMSGDGPTLWGSLPSLTSRPACATAPSPTSPIMSSTGTCAMKAKSIPPLKTPFTMTKVTGLPFPMRPTSWACSTTRPRSRPAAAPPTTYPRPGKSSAPWRRA